VGTSLLDLVLPRRCAVCGRTGTQLCPPCREALPRIEAPLCARCGAPSAWPVSRCGECAGRRLAFASARAAVSYDAAVRALVSAWKERALRLLAAAAAEIVTEALPRPDVLALTYVPPDGHRSAKRGHHPPERLAGELGRRWELPVEPLLERSRHLKQQRGLSLQARRLNVRGAFAPAAEAPTRVALVDDVYTSGATASAAASALRKGGARHVAVVTFARAVR
jgi:predicted amidophosphoribosyltransferase